MVRFMNIRNLEYTIHLRWLSDGLGICIVLKYSNNVQTSMVFLQSSAVLIKKTRGKFGRSDLDAGTPTLRRKSYPAIFAASENHILFRECQHWA